MKLTAAKQKIVDDALKAGFSLKEEDSSFDLIKLSNHKKPRVLAGLRIYEDGTAVRLDIHLSLAIGIRSHATMRSVLGI